jgi:protein TonB
MDVDDLGASGARWKRPALIAASVAICVAAGAWLMAGDSEAPPVARAFQIPAVETREAPGRQAPVAVQAQRLEDVFTIDVDAQSQDSLVRPADTGLDASGALDVSDPELDTAPEPNAQLASVAGAPAVSPAARTAGSLADVESAATAAKPERAPSEDPADTSPVRAGTTAEPADAPGAAADTAPGEAAATSAARADSAPELTGDLAKAQPPAGGEMPAIGRPMTSGPASGPNDYGPVPAPAPVDAGPLAVTMAELEFERFTEPKYPRSRDARTTRGWVQLEFTVNADGSTSDVRVADSSPPEVFDEAAMTAARKWRFKPYTVNGETVPVTSIVRLRFEPR